MKNISRKQAIKDGMWLTATALAGSRLKALDAITGGVRDKSAIADSAGNKGVAASGSNHRAAWLSGKWGIMTHWIAPGPGVETGTRITNLDEAADHFDLPLFMEQFRQTGAHHLIFSVGQNTTYYASPNPVMDKYMGRGHCTKRDLVLELAKAVKKQHGHFIAYLPAEIKNDPSMFDAFQWNPKDQTEFQRRYLEFVGAYARRWGKHVDAWWFDGCYSYEDYYVPRNWAQWCAVSRSGNPDAAVTFNNGSYVSGFTQPMTPLQDYISGECEGIRNGQIAVNNKPHNDKYVAPTHYAPGTTCQNHVLFCIDNHGQWINERDGPLPPPKYKDEELFPFVHSCLQAGAGLTLNIGLYQNGGFGRQTIDQLQRLNEYLLSSSKEHRR